MLASTWATIALICSSSADAAAAGAAWAFVSTILIACSSAAC
jgi:hypothetical protein